MAGNCTPHIFMTIGLLDWKIITPESNWYFRYFLAISRRPAVRRVSFTKTVHIHFLPVSVHAQALTCISIRHRCLWHHLLSSNFRGLGVLIPVLPLILGNRDSDISRLTHRHHVLIQGRATALQESLGTEPVPIILFVS